MIQTFPPNCKNYMNFSQMKRRYWNQCSWEQNLPETDGVIFPQMLGEAYREVEKIRKAATTAYDRHL